MRLFDSNEACLSVEPEQASYISIELTYVGVAAAKLCLRVILRTCFLGNTENASCIHSLADVHLLANDRATNQFCDTFFQTT